MRESDSQSVPIINSVRQVQGEPTDPSAAHNTLWRRWVLSHLLLLSAVWAADVLMFSALSSGLGGLLALPAVVITLFVAQGIAVWKLFPERREFMRWLFAFAMGFMLLILFVMRGFFSYPFWVAVLISGAVLGLAQGIILWRRYPRAFWWVPANAVGLVGALFLGEWSLQLLGQGPSSAGSAISLASAGTRGLATLILPVIAGTAIFSVITGSMLAWITQRERSTPEFYLRKYRGVTAGLLLLGGLFLVTLSFIPLWVAAQRTGMNLNDVDMVSTDEGWIVGNNNKGQGVILHYTADTRGWSDVSLHDSAPVATLRSVSMTSADEGWAVGENSTFLHYTNGEWSKVAPPDGTGPWVSITVVDMLSPSDGWALGHDVVDAPDILYHYDGQRWRAVGNPTNKTLLGMSFSSPSDGWAVGTFGATLHYTGSAWHVVTGGESVKAFAVQMLSPEEGWAVDGEDIRHYAGGTWSKAGTVPGIDFNAISMVSPVEGWAMGRVDLGSISSFAGAIAHYDGTSWTRVYLPGEAPFPSIFSVSMASAEEGWAVGMDATILHYEDGTWIVYR